MKPFFAILLLMIAVCVACEVRPTSSQANKSPVSVPSPNETAGTVSDIPPCSLVLDQAPVLNGVRLGMTSAEVLALFPGSSADPEVSASISAVRAFGVASFMIRPDKYQSKEKFAGVRQITFTLLDGRVSSINAGYNGPEWPHVDKFVEKFTEGTNLPAVEAWEVYVGFDTQMKTLTCKDFDIRIFAGGKGGNLNYVLMRDLVADKTLKDRKAKAKEKATP